MAATMEAHPLELPPVDAYGSRAALTLADLRALARQRSLRELAGKVRGRIAHGIRSQDSVIILVKDLDDIVVTPATGRLWIEEIGPAHLPALHELNRRRGASRKTRRFIGDLQRGCGGFAVMDGPAAVGYYWYAGGAAARDHADVRRLAGTIDLQEGDLYGFDYFLHEDARGRNTASEVLTLVETALREHGHRRVWGYVEADNRPARWLYATRRYTPVRKLTTSTLLGYRSHQVGAV